LRTSNDALAVRAAFARARSVAVIGAGFIGAEVAASARVRGLDVTVIEVEGTPLSRVLGAELGASTIDLHREHGTELRLGAGVVAGEQAADGAVNLTLSDGTTVEADVVVVGIGVEPNTAWLEGSGLELANGVVCDASLNAGHPGVFAVGDVASWPNPLFERRMRVEQWTNAIAQARHATRNLLDGARRPFEASNYFWSDQYGVRIQFAGIPSTDVQIVHGSLQTRTFLAWLTEGDRLVGAFAMNSSEPFMASKRLIEERADWEEALRAFER
jgi:NADPH-dependent 2,4-dienoyl-CoA reductase/sulfur reductase-like enzyme